MFNAARACNILTKWKASQVLEISVCNGWLIVLDLNIRFVKQQCVDNPEIDAIIAAFNFTEFSQQYMTLV